LWRFKQPGFSPRLRRGDVLRGNDGIRKAEIPVTVIANGGTKKVRGRSEKYGTKRAYPAD
jgi:hypothetical protein